ncbi:Protein of unknown function [Dyella jiangningensis]|uniref:DUF3606 domain-containing protein n=1 Tax=Dyella sp. AtDHG13 TaxID=1938897 RepID=UPI0008912D4B|nr:DUF3606 domain-containing protein [Dyella sp. AtDHG13]PXV55868.1 uncharacterized protein DUF3606 [Dyella sp. AtDHG13]SDK53070.1 Protein of unknown function [Dyella jiangningensis]
MSQDIKSDGKREQAVAHRTRIDITQENECRDWAERFGISEHELREIVAKVGPMADDVQRALEQR